MADCSSAASSGGSFFRDIFLMGIASVATCVAIWAYNNSVDRQVEEMTLAEKASKEEETRPVQGLLKQGGSKSVKTAKNFNNAVTGSIANELAHFEGGMEASGNFLSAILLMLWDHASEAVEKVVLEALEPILADLPVALKFKKLDLGTVPIKTTHMYIHKATGGPNAGVQIDFDVEWDGDCDISMEAKITKGTRVTFGIAHFKLNGRMSIIMGPLTHELPVTSAVQYGFINPPEIELQYTGAAQRLTDKLSFVDVKTKLVEVIRSVLAGVLCLPNRMVLPVNPLTYNYFHTYRPPVGMVRLATVSGRGFKAQRGKLVKDIPDIYCKISLGASGCLGKEHTTSTCRNALSPNWGDEHCDMILYDVDQMVYVEVYDEDKGPDPDDHLGDAEISVRDLFGNDGKCELELTRKGERTGSYVTVSSELFHLCDKLASHSSPAYSKKNELVGLVTIIVTKAFDIPMKKEDAATYVKVTYGEDADHEVEFCTAVVCDFPGFDSLNPTYDGAFHVPISAEMLKKKGKNNMTFTLIDGDCGGGGAKGRGELGEFVVMHEELVGAAGHVVQETRAIGNGGARLEFSVTLEGIQSEKEKMMGGLTSTPSVTTTSSLPAEPATESTPLLAAEPKILASPSPAPAVPEAPSVPNKAALSDAVSIRLTASSGRGFKIKKHRVRKDDVPDVYCKLNFVCPRAGSMSTWKTSTVKNDTDPVWNESREFVGIHPRRSAVSLEAYDAHRTRKDERLGSAEFSVEQLLKAGTVEVELQDGSGGRTDTFITLKCVSL